MEFNLIDSEEIVFGYWFEKSSKKRKIESITKTGNSFCSLDLDRVFDSNIEYDGDKSFRENSIDLFFGNSDLGKELKNRKSTFPIAAHLTLTSSHIGKLMIETQPETPEDDEADPETPEDDEADPETPEDDEADSETSEYKEADIFERLLELQESLLPNSIEFTLSVEGFKWNSDKQRGTLDFNQKGLKLMRNEGGSASLEVTNIKFPGDKWWKRWSGGRISFTGWLSLNVRLDITALTQMYKNNFGGGPSKIEIGIGVDMVIYVGGNKDKKKAIKCHKSVLSEMSPVFAAMFQTDMLEAKEGALEIVDFSETVIRALIEFGYRRNLEEALKSSEMTLELLQVADKYQMKNLMDMLLHIIWCMPFSWFSADVALKLFFYAKNAGEDLAQAEKRGWKVLRWYALTFPEKLIESKESVRLCENPRAVMELIVRLFKKNN